MRVDMFIPNEHWRRWKLWEPRWLRIQMDVPAVAVKAMIDGLGR